MRFHLALESTKAYSTLEADRAPFVNAVSFGESHTLMMTGYDGSTVVFSHEKQQKKEDLTIRYAMGFWYRVAIGFQTADEVRRVDMTPFRPPLRIDSDDSCLFCFRFVMDF